VLLRHSNEVFSPHAYVDADASQTSGEQPTRKLAQLLPSPSVNLSRAGALQRLASALADKGPSPVLVLGSGRQLAELAQAFAGQPNILLVSCDVDIGSDVDFYGDGHELPLVDGCVKAVITTAVLQLVLSPERVIEEIHRVLADDGLIYTEVAFMQQVTEGAYDFTRYTLSGHRRLCHGFVELSSGVVAGPGTALAWALERFALAFGPTAATRNALKGLARLSAFWLKYFDYLLRDAPAAADAASATFFLGQKRAGVRVSDQEIIARYHGAKALRHI
jgi:SAM-dependent methyltransferase